MAAKTSALGELAALFPALSRQALHDALAAHAGDIDGAASFLLDSASAPSETRRGPRDPQQSHGSSGPAVTPVAPAGSLVSPARTVGWHAYTERVGHPTTGTLGNSGTSSATVGFTDAAFPALRGPLLGSNNAAGREPLPLPLPAASRPTTEQHLPAAPPPREQMPVNLKAASSWQHPDRRHKQVPHSLAVKGHPFGATSSQGPVTRAASDAIPVPVSPPELAVDLHELRLGDAASGQGAPRPAISVSSSAEDAAVRLGQAYPHVDTELLSEVLSILGSDVNRADKYLNSMGIEHREHAGKLGPSSGEEGRGQPEASAAGLGDSEVTSGMAVAQGRRQEPDLYHKYRAEALRVSRSVDFCHTYSLFLLQLLAYGHIVKCVPHQAFLC